MQRSGFSRNTVCVKVRELKESGLIESTEKSQKSETTLPSDRRGVVRRADRRQALLILVLGKKRGSFPIEEKRTYPRREKTNL